MVLLLVWLDDIVLTCKNSRVDDLKEYPKMNYFDKSAHGSLILQQLVNCFHLSRSETEQILHRMGNNPGDVYFVQPLSLAQVAVLGHFSGAVLIKKRAKCGFFSEQDYFVVLFPDQVKEMLETNLDIIKF